jgi:hypothetical protein
MPKEEHRFPEPTEAQVKLLKSLSTPPFKAVAERFEQTVSPPLGLMLELGRELARGCDDHETASRLSHEIDGFDGVEVPPERRVTAFASPFPVRALDMRLLDPEEVFLVNREKFSQVQLSVGQPIAELETALGELQSGGVLAMRVPASEITAESADTDQDTEVYLYILPREIQRVVEAARSLAVRSLCARLVEAAG